jgi:hypothetical protein
MIPLFVYLSSQLAIDNMAKLPFERWVPMSVARLKLIAGQALWSPELPAGYFGRQLASGCHIRAV